MPRVSLDGAREQAANRTRRQKIVSAVATALLLAAAVSAAVLWDIPLLPV